MTKFFLSVFITLICSASSAFYQQTTSEHRNNETWVTIKMDVGAQTRSDVLFVIDDSGSMQQHQKNLAAQAALLAQSLSFYTDIQTAVITTSGSNSFTPNGGGKFVGPVLSSTSSNFVTDLQKQINVGTMGDATEMIFDPLYFATTEPLLSTTNKDFFRADADLLLVILTDTEDQSTQTTGAALLAHLKGLKTNADINVLYVGITDLKTCEGESEVQNLVALKEFVALAGGQTVDLCSDFSKEIPTAIEAIKNSVTAIELATFPNTRVDFQTVSVLADANPLTLGDSTNGWYYDTLNSKVLLGQNVITNTTIREITVTYRLLPL